MFKTCLENVRTVAPLLDNITNFVTVNDCANIQLACGASPIMADHPGEVEEIVPACGGLCINLGTLTDSAIQAMFLAGKKANELGKPIVLDPVGVGASRLRTDTADRLLREVRFTVIRGNISEIKCLAAGAGSAHGVDAAAADKVTDGNLDQTVAFAQDLSRRTGAAIAISGAIDIVADPDRAYVIRNGVETMARITGSGCMLTALLGAYLAANPDNALEAAAACVCAMGLCGELAYEKMVQNGAGNSSFRNYLIDAVFDLDGDTLERGAKYELR